MTQLGSKKSRKGCAQCKRRRVKCSEESPCSNCIRRGEACSLAAPSPSTTAVSAASRESEDLPLTTAEWLEDMTLMHHYSTVMVNEPLLVRDNVAIVWTTFIPQQALRHAFLLHGLLAFSALNLADVNRGTPDAARYLSICDKHQAIAVGELRDKLEGGVTADNSAALFALAATISISSMARSCAMANAHPPPRAFSVEEIAEVIFLTKGMREVTGVTHEFVKDTPIALMLTRHSVDDDEKAAIRLPKVVVERFAALRAMVRTFCGDEEATLVSCLAALDELEDVFLNIRHFKQHGLVESGHIWRWPAAVPYDFARLIMARHPPTLIIVAYFAAATSCLRRAWYVRDWGAYALEGIGRALDEGMQEWLEWPRLQMVDEMAVVLT